MSGSGQVKAEPCSRYREPPVQRNPEVEEKEPVSTGTYESFSVAGAQLEMGYVRNEATGGRRPDHENPCLLSGGAWNMLDSQRRILKGLEAEKFKIRYA